MLDRSRFTPDHTASRLTHRGSTSRTALIWATLFLLTLLALPLQATANVGDRSPDGIWQEVQPPAVQHVQNLQGTSLPRQFRLLEVNQPVLTRMLNAAPLEFTGAAEHIITLPMPDGSFARFAITESPIYSPEMQSQHPEIKTYSGQGIDDPTARVRCDVTMFGFRAMIASPSGTVLIDPYNRRDTRYCMSYWKRDVPFTDDFVCGVTGESLESLDHRSMAVMASGNQLTTYRMVVTVTGEYTEHWANIAGATTRADSIAASLAQITTTFNRVTGIYENDVAVRFIIHKTIIFLSPATDRFPNEAGTSELNDSNVVICNDSVGIANFDIGHILSQGGSGGIAGLGVVCDTWKAWGGTSRGNPSGDAFDVDYVAHEVGHQMGGSHTFNGTTGSCGGGNRSAGNAYEPGSGSTIQAYAGICGGEDLQPHSDPYFHVRSLEQIIDRRNSAGCGTVTGTGNNPPSANAGPDYTIPRETPFTLHGSGGDPDGDALTYCWEQYDLGAATPPDNMADGPLFRSLSPTVDPTRTLPQMSTLLAGTYDKWERLPTVDRTLTWKLSVRDNRASGGGVDWDEMIVTVAGAPFAVTYPNGGETVTAGCETTIRWDVGGGSIASHVDIRYSTDGGHTTSMLLANTPNDGSETVMVPCTPTTQGRIVIEPVGDHIFFDLSDDDFEIKEATISMALAASDVATDDTCGAIVTFTGGVTNSYCQLDVDDVAVSVALLTGNAYLGDVTYTKTLSGTSILVNGTAYVSSLTSSPAQVEVTLAVTAPCGGSDSRTEVVEVSDDHPAEISVTAAGGPVDANCEATVTFSGTVLDNCFVEADDITITAEIMGSGATGSNLTVNKTQFADRRVDFSGSYLVSDLTTSPVPVQVIVTAIDGGGNVAIDGDTVYITDPIPLTVTALAFGGPVDENCEYLVTFEGTAADNCPLFADDVLVDVDLLTGNAMLGTPLITKDQPDAYTVAVSGSVLVSGLTSSPATVQVTITASDAGGHTESATATADVIDTIPPVITCPNDIVAEFTSPTEANVFFEATATDNCDPEPTIVYSIDPGSVFMIGSHTITCVATDDSFNADTCSFDFELVPLDIHPTSCPNPLNVNIASSTGGTPTAAAAAPRLIINSGVVPVAILGTPTLDVTTIDVATLELEGVPWMKWHYEDVATPVADDTTQSCECTTAGPDGIMDLVMHFDRVALVATLGAVAHKDELMFTLTGRHIDGTPIAGGDCVVIKGNVPEGLLPGPASVSRGGSGEFSVANYPNPFNAATVIRYELPDAGHVTIAVYNILGQNIKTLVDREHTPGAHSVTWDGTNRSGAAVASGMYFYRVQVGDEVVTKKMSLLK